MQSLQNTAAAVAAVLLCAPVALQAQVAARNAAAQPRIIVIPFTKEGEDIRTILEADFNRQVAVAKLKKAFDNRKFSTVDFQAALAAMKRDIATGAESERDFRDRLFETYKADIYVTVTYRATVESGLTSVAVIMDSYMTANALSLSTETARSRRNREPDVSAHIEQAIDDLGPDFLNGIQEKFDEFQTAGVPLALTARIASGSAIDMNTIPKGQKASLADLIEDWGNENAVAHGTNVGTQTKNMFQFSEIRAPIREPNGTPLSPRRFGSRLVAYLASIGVTATPSATNGAIYVDIH